MSSDPRTTSVVASLERWTSNAGGGICSSRQSLAEPPQIGRARLVSNFVEHGLRDVNTHAALGEGIGIEIARQRGDSVDVERVAVILHFDDELALVRCDRDVDGAAAFALVRVD